MVKRLSVYGDYITHGWVIEKKKVWVIRRDGVLQRYWKKTLGRREVEKSGRYEFYGTGKDLYKAVFLAHQYMPKDYIEVEARDFIEDPEEYGVPGEWLQREIES